MRPDEPFQYGKITLPNRIFYAPLAGCSDFPFRKMSAKFRPGLMFCEMVKMEALIRHDPHTFHLLDYSSDMHPIGAQLCGSNPKNAGRAARIIESLGFDVVDFNCGCPVDKVTNDGSGSAMLLTPDLIGEVISEMVAAVNIPVTVKIRAGWDESRINSPDIVKIAERAGATAICIHGRTRQQAYRGSANWDYIKACKEAATTILVIGNGDVIDGPSAQGLFEKTKCDAVLVGRQTMGQPWVVQNILQYFRGEAVDEWSLEDCREALLEHYYWMKRFHNDYRVCVDMRRVGCWYLKKSSGTRQFREVISRVSDINQIEELIRHFPLGEEAIGEIESSKAQRDDCCG